MPFFLRNNDNHVSIAAKFKSDKTYLLGLIIERTFQFLSLSAFLFFAYYCIKTGNLNALLSVISPS